LIYTSFHILLHHPGSALRGIVATSGHGVLSVRGRLQKDARLTERTSEEATMSKNFLAGEILASSQSTVWVVQGIA